MKNLIESSYVKKDKKKNIFYKFNLAYILIWLLLLLIIISIVLITFVSILKVQKLIEFSGEIIFNYQLNIKNKNNKFFNSSILNSREIKLYKMLCPKEVTKKKKNLVGNFGDGGYVLLDDLEDIKIAYSFGIRNEFSFDKALANKGINVYMYDHTINNIQSNDTKLHWKKIGLGSENSKKNI